MASIPSNPLGSAPLQRHRDPQEEPPPNVERWSAFWRDTYHSHEMREYRDALCLPGSDDMRASILDDLSEYFRVTPDDALHLAKNWGEACVGEWQSARDPLDFHRTTRSSSFSLLWYAYLQASGLNFPASAGIARSMQPLLEHAAHLDFGSGIGVTSQLFARLGCETTLADVATKTLDFARFRLERRGQRATYLDLNREALPEARYDVVTAIDVLVHVPDFGATARALHRALKPGGLLYANIVVPADPEAAPWHLYRDERPLRRALQIAGFEPVLRLSEHYGEIYTRVEDHGVVHTLRAARDAVQFSPLRSLARAVIGAQRHAWHET